MRKTLRLLWMLGSRPTRIVRLLRNLWILRRELWAHWRGKPVAGSTAPKGIAIRCLRCGNELTKPCKPGWPTHVFKWPIATGPFERGQLVYVRRTKPGQPVNDIRAQPW